MNNYREKELSLNNVMLSAQRFADQLTVDAERKAAEIIANAEREAEKIVGSTQEKYNQVLADYAILANRYNDAKETLRDYFRTQLTILDQDEAGIASAEVAEYIKQAEQLPQAVAEAETVVDYNVGDAVKITDGPFTGFDGTVEEIVEDRSKLKVMVMIFGRKTLLELNFTQVTKE